MALNATRLAGGKATDDQWITLVNPNCVERHMLALVDQEWMLIGNTLGELIGTTPPRPTVGVVPGYDGSVAGPHAPQAVAIVGRPADFQTIGLIPGQTVVSQSVSGTWSFITGPAGLPNTTPIANTIVYLASTDTSANYQLSAPTADQRNTLTFVNVGGGAGSVHYAPGFGGNAGSTVMSVPIGAVGTIRAHNGTWVPMATADGGAEFP